MYPIRRYAWRTKVHGGAVKSIMQRFSHPHQIELQQAQCVTGPGSMLEQVAQKAGIRPGHTWPRNTFPTFRQYSIFDSEILEAKFR